MKKFSLASYPWTLQSNEKFSLASYPLDTAILWSSSRWPPTPCMGTYQFRTSSLLRPTPWTQHCYELVLSSVIPTGYIPVMNYCSSLLTPTFWAQSSFEIVLACVLPPGCTLYSVHCTALLWNYAPCPSPPPPNQMCITEAISDLI